MGVGIPVYTGQIHYHINHITAQLVALHINRRTVRGDIDLRDNIEEEGFLDTRILKRGELQ